MDKHITELKILRGEFAKRFNRQKLETMTVDEYSLNSQDNALSRESFCYWVETKLRGLGSMQGGTSMKFGTYFGYLKPDTSFQRRWASWTDESFDTVRTALIELYDAGETENIEAIQKSKLSPMFKGKLLSLYFPHRYLNIFALWHLHHFLNKLSIPHGDNDDPVVLRELLIAYRKTNPAYADMDAIDFGHALYGKYGNPSEEEAQREPAEALYEHSQKQVINSTFKKVTNFPEQPEPVPEQISTSYGQVYKINPAKSRRAIIDAGFVCEVDADHETFTRKDEQRKYTEAHHLIPRRYQKNYAYSLDVTANIVSLCSNCHNCLHYGSKDEREALLARLFFQRYERLKEVGLVIALQELRTLYS
ncbi:MAG: HNH endonuclease [Defluviitaleaceae bacterium]|nr:HNH endonuclease [Defluviitaleaceae bacterium]